MKRLKNLTALTVLSSLALMLSGCVRTTKSGHPYGFVYDYLAKPTQSFMSWLAQFVGGYGWAIVVLTVVVRMILLPLMVRQMRASTVQQEKISMIRPQMAEIQKRQKSAKTQEEQAAAGQAMMRLYKDNNISMTGGIGCLPLLIQFPVFTALYAAIRYSPELSTTVFMGIKLGQSSLVLAILSFLSYLLQGYLSILGVPKEQKRQMGMMMLLSPIMILFFTLTTPAGLGIYFFIGGLFACVQTLIINLYRPKIRKRIAAESANVKPVTVDDLMPKKTTNSDNQSKISKRNRQRNAGKQHKKVQVEDLKPKENPNTKPVAPKNNLKNNQPRNAGKQHHRNRK